MKHAGLIPTLLLPCLLLGQTSQTSSSNKLVTFGYSAKGSDRLETGMASVTGREIRTTDSLIKCSGNCELKIHEVVVNSDEVDIQPKTGDTEVRGNVKIKVLPQ
jgi:lipopolysaccharide assembly outer membrane protein LptD (OstA)